MHSALGSGISKRNSFRCPNNKKKRHVLSYFNLFGILFLFLFFF